MIRPPRPEEILPAGAGVIAVREVSLARRVGQVVRVADLIAPVRVHPVRIGLLDREVRHEGAGRGTVPVPDARLRDNRVAVSDLFNGAASLLDSPNAIHDVQHLANRVAGSVGLAPAGEGFPSRKPRAVWLPPVRDGRPPGGRASRSRPGPRAGSPGR